MDGKRLLTKKQLQAELGVGRRMVEDILNTPGCPVRKEKGKETLVWEPEFWPWFRKEWRR